METATEPTVSSAPMPIAYIPTTQTEVVKVVILGIIAGIIIPLLSWLLADYFITPVFCHQGGDMGICGSGGIIANHIAAVVVGIGAFAVLNRWRVYRALLLVLAVTIALWGFKKYANALTTDNWLEYYSFSALLYTLAYALFYWVLRLRNFVASVIVLLAAVVAACWMWVA